MYLLDPRIGVWVWSMVQLFHINQKETGGADLSKFNIIFDHRNLRLTRDKQDNGRML